MGLPEQLSRARELCAAARYSEAAGAVQEPLPSLVAEFGEHHEHVLAARLLLARALGELGEHGLAVELARQAAAEVDARLDDGHPLRTEGRYVLGHALRLAEEGAQAEPRLRQAAEAGHPDAMVSLGVLLHRAGSPAEAEEWWRRAAGTGNSGAMFTLGALHDRRGEAGEAELRWRRAAEAGHVEAMTSLGVRYAGAGRRRRRAPGGTGRRRRATAWP